MNINDYKDGNGNVEVSEQLISDLVDGANKLINPTAITITTFENGWEGELIFSRYGDLISIKGLLMRVGTVTNGTVLASIPANFRPFATTPVIVAKGNISPFNTIFLFNLTTGGNLEVRTTDTMPSNVDNAYLGINQVYSALN